jgi:protein tyrosine phosphatase (PTP) superfamily phosphohydrolase (DUF442 family)
MQINDWLAVLIAILVFQNHAQTEDPRVPNSAQEPTNSSAARIKLPGIQNVFRITDKLLSGSSPEDEIGFKSLQKLGVKTIISVDGAQPDLKNAHKLGMRYVHIPIGYDGVPFESALRMAKAVRDLPGPVYIHCHHGQHRGPASAAVIHLVLEPNCKVDQALAEMKRAGTDPKYKGLYAAPSDMRKVAHINLDAVPSDFLESVKPAAFADVMVHVDEQWDKLKLIKAARWQTPKDHPDVTPAHEALLLVEQFREAARLPTSESRPKDFRDWLQEAQTNAEKLEGVLQAGANAKANADAAEQAFKAVNSSCTRCHARYRDVPQADRRR